MLQKSGKLYQMNDLRKIPVFLLQLLVGWLLAAPLSYLIRKQKNLITFIGRDDGSFTDNVKYFYLYLHELNPQGFEYYFITENINTFDILNEHRLPVLKYPSLKSIWILIRSNILIVDNWTWITNIKYHLLINCLKIQLWHGIPLKKIELDTDIETKNNNSLYIKIRNILGCRYPTYDCLVSTSQYISSAALCSAFKSKNIINTGYPRNDILFNPPDNLHLIETDIDNYQRILGFKESNYKIVLYTPTFRDTGGDIIEDSKLDLQILSIFAKDNNIVFVFKFHPNTVSSRPPINLDNIIEYKSSSDMYPLFGLSDILITDYSSTYFDYLLLNKSIIFFSYDLKNYLEKNREMYFKYDTFTPGAIVNNQSELQNEILNIITDSAMDHYYKSRKQLGDKIFDHTDANSSKRLWNHIQSNYSTS